MGHDMDKTYIRFFNDREVRAVWDDAINGWFFSALDVVGVLNRVKGDRLCEK